MVSLPIEQRKWFEKIACTILCKNIRTMDRKYKTLFKPHKTRKVENRKITDYFSIETVNSNNLIIENTHNITPTRSNSRFQCTKDKIKSGTNNRQRKQEILTLINNSNVTNYETQSKTNGKIEMQKSKGGKFNIEHNRNFDYQHTSVASTSNKSGKLFKHTVTLDPVQKVKYTLN